MKLMIAAAALLALSLLGAGSAFAQTTECTEELAAEKSGALFAELEADPSKEENLEQYVAEVEAEFGGEPSPEQVCDALDMLIEKVRAGE